MKPPFTSEQFLEVFRKYNVAVFPMQIVFYFLGFIMIYFVVKSKRNSNKILIILLAILWFWMGIVYHLIFFSSINKLAYLFGGLFIIQGILFLVYGIIKNKFLFHFKKNIYGITGMILMLFAIIAYPILGFLFGHIYPNSPTFGLPCPTTIFTFGMLLLNQNKCPISIIIIPFVWSIIGFMAVFQFGILEDASLLMLSLIAIWLLVYQNRKMVYQINKQNETIF